MSITIQKENELDNQHLIENHHHLITIKQNRLQLIRIIIRSIIQISSLAHQKRQAKRENVTWQHFNDNFIFIIIIF